MPIGLSAGAMVGAAIGLGVLCVASPCVATSALQSAVAKPPAVQEHALQFETVDGFRLRFAKKLPQGAVSAVTVYPPAEPSAVVAAALFDGRPLLLTRTKASGRAWVGILAVGAEALPGPYPLEVTVADRQGRARSARTNIWVVARPWKEEHIRVDRAMDRLPEHLREQVAGERQEIGAGIKHFSRQAYWLSGFVRPVAGEVTSAFGTRRLQNNRPRSPHWGVDFRAAMQTPVRASAAGVVRVAGSYYFPGGLVVLDHGGGLVSMYAHLNVVKVKVGAQVKQGAIIGLSGKSGRVTGPHLHWAARWHGQRVEPLDLLRLALPLQ